MQGFAVGEKNGRGATDEEVKGSRRVREGVDGAEEDRRPRYRILRERASSLERFERGRELSGKERGLPHFLLEVDLHVSPRTRLAPTPEASECVQRVPPRARFLSRSMVSS